MGPESESGLWTPAVGATDGGNTSRGQLMMYNGRSICRQWLKVLRRKMKMKMSSEGSGVGGVGR